MVKPKVSIIMSTCNGECYLRDCIESVLEQSLPGFEFLIIDDCSRDSSVRIIRSYSDSRIKLIGQNRENKGLFYGLNELIRHSSSELIKVWSQDDIMLRSCLEEGVSFHEKHPEAGCFYTSYYIIDSKGDIIQKLADDNKVFVLTQEEGDKFLLTCGSVCGNISTLFFLKEVFKNVGYFKEDCISGDFEMMVRTLSKYKIALINKPLMKLRRHKRQWSRQPEAIFKFLEANARIYAILKYRMLNIHKSLSGREADGLIRNHYISFLGSLASLFLRGEYRRFFRLSKELNRRGPLIVLAYIWLISRLKAVRIFKR